LKATAADSRMFPPKKTCISLHGRVDYCREDITTDIGFYIKKKHKGQGLIKEHYYVRRISTCKYPVHR
jgi:hypothetical protein